MAKAKQNAIGKLRCGMVRADIPAALGKGWFKTLAKLFLPVLRGRGQSRF